ncbi:MAG: prolyl oligopeptidase family serine peptidase [Gammaproteobacteria bacterium]|nr:prolyl oligopeptidase family serine peptidase [Gammaproteobacteria bacterium]
MRDDAATGMRTVHAVEPPLVGSPVPARRMERRRTGTPVLTPVHSRPRIQAAARDVEPPRAIEEVRCVALHGDERRDEFAYLRDPADRRTKQYIREENEYFLACFDAVSGFQQQLYDELKARVIEDDTSVPESIKGRLYYTRVEAGRQYPVHCRCAPGGVEEIYLDENEIAGSGRYCEVSVVSLCPQQKRVAFSVDHTGDERYDIYIARIPDDGFTRCAAAVGNSIAWSLDGRQLLYTGVDANARPDSVWVYDIEKGTRRRIYTDPDPAFYVTVWLSRSGEWIFIDSAGNTASETLVMPSTGDLREPVVLIPRRDEVEYMVDHHGDRFLVLINDTAENFRLTAVPLDALGGEAGVELISPDDRVTIEFIDAYRHHWIVGELRDGVKHISVRDPATGVFRYLPGSGALSHLGVEDLYDYDARYVRYEYTTPVTPHTTYDLDIETGQPVWRKSSSPPGYIENDYVTRRFNVRSGDVEVPLSLVCRRDTLPAGGVAPLLLTGYGAYEESVDMQFDSDLISLMDRGVVVASAHVRGGGDLGPAWHDAGRLSAKENSFHDFLACADYLVEHGYTAPGRIAAWGSSAGGLLVAVAAQRKPELFASVVLEVPFLDVVNTLLDTGLPLTEHDFDEFGNPAVEEEYHWMRSYCPYDNIRPQAYPPMLVITAMNDQRVGYWEALKWTARMRAMRSDDNPLLLKVDQMGHLGESGRYESVRENAVVYTFLLDVWGLAPDR